MNKSETKRYGYFFHGHTPGKGQFIEMKEEDMEEIFDRHNSDYEFCVLYVLKNEMYQEIRAIEDKITIGAVIDKNDSFIFKFNFDTKEIVDVLETVPLIPIDGSNPMMITDSQIWLSENYGNRIKAKMITCESTLTSFRLSIDEQVNRDLSVLSQSLTLATVQIYIALRRYS